MNNAPTKYYLRQHQQNRLYDTVVEALERAEIPKKEVAKKLGVHPSQVSRWLSGPANWETDTVSDLLFAIGAELDFRVVSFVERNQRKGNRFHPAGETRSPVVPVLSSASGTTTSTAATSYFVYDGPSTVAISTATPRTTVMLANA